MDALIQEIFQSKDLEERQKLLMEKWRERLAWLKREAEYDCIPEKRS